MKVVRQVFTFPETKLHHVEKNIGIFRKKVETVPVYRTSTYEQTLAEVLAYVEQLMPGKLLGINEFPNGDKYHWIIWHWE